MSGAATHYAEIINGSTNPLFRVTARAISPTAIIRTLTVPTKETPGPVHLLPAVTLDKLQGASPASGLT